MVALLGFLLCSSRLLPNLASLGGCRPRPPLLCGRKPTGQRRRSDYAMFLVRPHRVFIGGYLSAPLAVVKVLKDLDYAAFRQPRRLPADRWSVQVPIFDRFQATGGKLRNSGSVRRAPP